MRKIKFNNSANNLSMSAVFAVILLAYFSLNAQASLITNITAYYNYSFGYQDAVGNFPMFNTGLVANISGIIGNGVNFTASYLNNTATYLGSANQSITFWFKAGNSGSDRTIFSLDSVDSNANAAGLGLWNGGSVLGVYPFDTTTGDGLINISVATTTLIKDNNWHFVAVTWTDQASSTKIYVDGVSQPVSQSNSKTSNPKIQGIIRVGQRKDGGNKYNGSIDEVGVWNRTLGDSEITALYNSGAGLTYPFGAIEILNISLILKNYNGTIYPSITNEDDFSVNINFTNQTSVKNNSNCSMLAASNPLIVNELRTFTDFNLSSPSVNQTINVTLPIINDTLDIMRFRVCQVGSGIGSNVQMYINTTLYRTIPSAQIPQCVGRSAFHEEFNTTNAFLNFTKNNLTVACSGGCGTAGRFVMLLYDEDGGTLHYHRQYTATSENLTFNSTSQLYSSALRYQYLNTPLNITATCDGNSQNFIQTVILNNLTFNITSINQYTFVNGMTIESNTSYNITTDIRGGNINYEQINVTFSNGTLIKTVTNNESVFLNSSDIPKNGIYNLSVFGSNDIGVTYFNNSWFFNVTDTIKPEIIYIYPLPNTTQMQGDTVVINVNCTDINLFAYELDVYAPNGTLIITQNQSGLNQNISIFQNVFLNAIGTWTIATYCSDSHTSKKIKDIAYALNNDSSVTFFGKEKHSGVNIFSNVTLKSLDNEYQSMTLTKLLDRYSFNYSYKNPMTVLNFELSGSDFQYIEDQWPGHFASFNSYQWIDFNSSLTDSVSIIEKSPNDFLIRVKLTQSTKDITFNSIGGLNINNVNATIPVTKNFALSTVFTDGVCPETIQGQFGLYAVIFILLCAIIAGFVIRKSIISLFASIGLIAMAFPLAGCTNIVALIVALIGLICAGLSFTTKMI